MPVEFDILSGLAERIPAVREARAAAMEAGFLLGRQAVDLFENAFGEKVSGLVGTTSAHTVLPYVEIAVSQREKVVGKANRAPESIYGVPSIEDTNILRKIDRVPFGLNNDEWKDYLPRRGFVLTKGLISSPHHWCYATSRGDYSGLAFFRGREMFPNDSHTQSILGPEVSVLFQHFDGETVSIDEELAKRAGVIMCCHPERLPNLLRAKHTFPDYTGLLFQDSRVYSSDIVPSGEIFMVFNQPAY